MALLILFLALIALPLGGYVIGERSNTILGLQCPYLLKDRVGKTDAILSFFQPQHDMVLRMFERQCIYRPPYQEGSVQAGS